MSRYRRNAGATVSLTYHLVRCPKSRRKVLAAPDDTRLREIIAEGAAEAEMTVHAVEVMPDHVHLFVEADPTRAVAEIVNRFKGRSSLDRDVAAAMVVHQRAFGPGHGPRDTSRRVAA
ncbi:IS200/IS605 family transposase [uncultured Methylobacterium sp.]|uniref:IS200/IS605 family transposase n=1 Tax=uncultured Methylobacterium sp. TaxID=157278 RepID=UPI002594A183|nr:IS200/IS605 family transposase [uncultured Methylobacterium sp.]